MPAGIIGARLWYVLNAILGGNRSYLDNPASIFHVWEGGLHIFGGFLFGALALLFYLRKNNLDPWLYWMRPDLPRGSGRDTLSLEFLKVL